MGLYGRIISNTYKSAIAYRFNYILATMFSFVALVLQISIWKALYAGKGVAVLSGIALSDMIAYSIITLFSSGIIVSKAMYEINDMVVDGEIAQRLLLPLGFRRHFFMSNISSNVFTTICSSLPPCIVAVLLYGFKIDLNLMNLGFYIISLGFAFIINFNMNFVFGLSVFWLKNAFFLQWTESAFNSLFSGKYVPMWFFPGWLSDISLFLPFRYIVFEPTAILLGKYSISGMITVLAAQVVWIAVLYLLGNVVWNKGKKIVFSQGG